MPESEFLLDLVRQTLTLALVVSAPILGAGVAIGLTISIIQSVTSIQEQTLTFVPKIAGMLLVTIALIAWISERLLTFASEMFTLL